MSDDILRKISNSSKLALICYGSFITYDAPQIRYGEEYIPLSALLKLIIDKLLELEKEVKILKLKVEGIMDYFGSVKVVDDVEGKI